MLAVILAGGLATRMLPRTATVPKSLLVVAGRPFVDWQLEALRDRGFTDAVLCVGHLGEQIRARVEDGARYGLRVRYSEDGPSLRGTGGALRGALERDLLPADFLVTYGDSYLPFDYGAPLHALGSHSDCDGVMTIYENHDRFDRSNVIAGEGWVRHYAKGTSNPAFTFIDYGAVALRRSAVEKLPPEGGSLEPLLSDLAAGCRLRALVAKERFFEIGSPEGLAQLEARLSSPAPSKEKSR